MLKSKRILIKVSLAMLGASYLTSLSNLDLNIIIKSYVAIMPVQLLALGYGIYLIYNQKSQGEQYPPR